MTLAQKLRNAGRVFHTDVGYEADLLRLAASTLEEALRILLVEPINEETYADLVRLISEGAKK